VSMIAFVGRRLIEMSSIAEGHPWCAVDALVCVRNRLPGPRAPSREGRFR
jgi:hypothetical protein